MPSKVHCHWRNLLDGQIEFGDIMFYGRPCLRGPIQKLEVIKRQGEASEEVEWVRITVHWLARKDSDDLTNTEVPWTYQEGERLAIEFPNNSKLWGFELTYPPDGSNFPTRIKCRYFKIFVGRNDQLDPNKVEGFPI